MREKCYIRVFVILSAAEGSCRPKINHAQGDKILRYAQDDKLPLFYAFFFFYAHFENQFAGDLNRARIWCRCCKRSST